MGQISIVITVIHSRDTYVTVLLSPVATSVFALFSTFWNSVTRCRILECMYALEHLM